MSPASRAQLQGALKHQHDGGGVAHVEIAGAVFPAEVGGIENVAAGDQRALVGVPVHGVRVGVVGVQVEAAAAVARDLEDRRLIGGVGAAMTSEICW